MARHPAPDLGSRPTSVEAGQVVEASGSSRTRRPSRVTGSRPSGRPATLSRFGERRARGSAERARRPPRPAGATAWADCHRAESSRRTRAVEHARLGAVGGIHGQHVGPREGWSRVSKTPHLVEEARTYGSSRSACCARRSPASPRGSGGTSRSPRRGCAARPRPWPPPRARRLGRSSARRPRSDRSREASAVSRSCGAGQAVGDRLDGNLPAHLLVELEAADGRRVVDQLGQPADVGATPRRRSPSAPTGSGRRPAAADRLASASSKVVCLAQRRDSGT
jgi:hypothetical protein